MLVVLYVFKVDVQCFLFAFDVLCDGVFGTISPLTFTGDVWFE